MYVQRITTVSPRSSDPFYIVTSYIKWVTSSWTDSSNPTAKELDLIYNGW